MSETDIVYMQQAFELAKYAASQHEVPVGAVLVLDDKIIAEGWNQPIASNDPTAHAEIVALRDGANYLDNYRLLDTIMYVTLEPCAMCVGAMVHARIKRLVFGAYDPKAGAVVSTIKLLSAANFNHKFSHTGGILEQQCGQLLTDFFQARRNTAKVKQRKPGVCCGEVVIADDFDDEVKAFEDDVE